MPRTADAHSAFNINGIGLVRKVFAALDQDASGSLGVGEAEFFIQYVLVRCLAGVTQTLPQGTMSSDNDNQDDMQS